MSARIVMVVDDDVELRESLCEFLEDDGYRTLSASDGAAALARLREEPEKPALILLDLMMPGMNGWQFREAQLGDSEVAEVPVVVMTASRDVADIAVSEVVYKPIKLSRLLDVVSRHTGGTKGQKVPSAKAGPLDLSASPVRAGVNEVLAGGGEMGARMRAFDWSTSPVGEVASWPQSLRAAMSICLGSRFPICIYWGPSLATLYNDGWSTIPGTKHPSALGKPAKEVWPEIWDTISGWFERVIGTGESIYQEGQFLAMHRHGYTEECYFDFTFSPIRGDSGGVEGVFNAVVETTFRFVNERRTRVLRDLSEAMAPARKPSDACVFAADSLGAATHDVPFCAIYLAEDDATQARLVASSGLPPDSSALPRTHPLDDHSPWPLQTSASSKQVEIVRDLSARFGMEFPGGAWPESANAAFVAPLLATGKVCGYLLLGANPRRAIDDDYLLFVERAASHLAGVIATAMDYEKERRRAEALAEIDRAKTSFFSNVSHELRTPLTLMLGPAEDMLSGLYGELGNSHREQLEILRRNGLRLHKLVNALLDFSRLEAGRVQASYESVDLSALTREVASAFETAVGRAGLRFAIDCPPVTGPVYVDRDMWEKIVLNLLSNALKFTFEGSIEVSLRAKDNHVEFVVTDTGIGISAADLPRLFERFYRIEGVRARTHEGSGIGLALVQELAKLHGGTVQVESRPGTGTTFTVSMPKGSAHLPKERIGASGPQGSTEGRTSAFVEEVLRWLPGERASESESPSPSRAPDHDTSPVAAAPARILLADDNADMREYVQRHLERLWTVEAVADGSQALAAARERPPNLILTDVMMPGLDGFELLRELRNDERTSRIPVIMLSARAGEEAKVDGLYAGAEDYLTKPFSARELLARVQTHLELARLRRAVEAERDRLRTLLGEVPAIVNFLRGPELVFEYAHPLAVQTLGGRQLVGKAFVDALPEMRDQKLPAVLGRVFQTGERVEGKDSLLWLDRDGSGHLRETYWNFVYLPVRDEEGRVEGVMTFDVEVTEQVVARRLLEESEQRVHELLKSEQAARKEADTSYRARLDEMERALKFSAMFVGILGHDLRNPLSAITTAAQVLERRADSEKIAKPASRIVASADRMERMISQLLDFTRVRLGGGLPLDPAETDLGAVSRAIIDELEPVQKRQIQLEVVGDAVGTWDHDRLSQLLSNLAANACQHGARDAHVLIQLNGSKTDVVRVGVTNRGVIPAELLPVIFEPLRSGQRHERRDGSSGLGLGLYITHQIALAHGGTIRVESKDDRTCFIVELPRHVAPETGPSSLTWPNSRDSSVAL